MTSYTIKIDERTAEGKQILDYLKSSNNVTITKIGKIKKTGIEVALEDIEKGRVYRAKDAKDLIEKCLE